MKPSIWAREPTVDALNALHEATTVAHLGITFTGVGPDWMSARMPVDARTVQPYGILHGGASVVLAETLGSCGANYCVDDAACLCVGQEVNANHIRPAASGWVTGIARPVHLGRTTQVWSIELRDDAERLTCISRLTMAVVARGKGERA